MPALPRSVRSRLVSAALCAAAFVATGSSAQEPKVLHVYNWTDYIGEETIAGFEKETGIKVRYDTFETNEALHAKLVAGKSGYDVVVPSSYWVKAQVAAGLLQPLDKALLSNLKNIDPAIQEQLARLDPGNQYMVPWLWGYTTLGINVVKVKKALGTLPMPDNAWDLLFKTEYVSRLKRCGVSIIDAPTEVIPPALQYLGRPPFSGDLADYTGVSALLASIRPYITQFSSAGYIDELASGRLCLVMGYSGDINIAKRRALEKKTRQTIEALIAKTGGILFVDAMVIPADAPHPRNAHLFIDYILRPEVHAGLTNAVFYANPNKASLPFVRPDVANDRTIFLSPEDLLRMVPADVLGNDARRLMGRVFTKFKTGR